MSSYNILNSQVSCTNCEHQYPVSIQFRFGDTWQFVYDLGNTLKWGGNDVGLPGLPFVKVYGISESDKCPFCGIKNNKEYDIIVKNDRIISIENISDLEIYSADPEGNYSIIETIS